MEIADAIEVTYWSEVLQIKDTEWQMKYFMWDSRMNFML